MIERDLKDYIVKLNDRNIQRQRETGFTLYAILGAIIFCFFYLIDNIGVFISIKNDINFLNIAVVASNTIFIFSYFYFSYETITRKRLITKIFPFQEPISITIADSPLFLAFTAICFLNFVHSANSQSKLHHWYLIFFACVTGLNLISPFIMLIWKGIKRRIKKKRGLSIEVIDFTVGNDKMVKGTYTVMLVYAVALSIFSIVTLSSIQYTIQSTSMAEVIKYVSIFFGLLYFVKTTTDIKSKEKDNYLLEDFEKEIFFENISNEEIAKRFETDFSGVPFSKWINDKYNEVMDFFNTKRQEFISCDLLIYDLAKINKTTLLYEHNGRLNNIIAKQIRLLNETNDFAQKIRTNFNTLKTFASLNEQEAQDLIYVQTYFKNNIDIFNNLYNKLSQQIAEQQK
jgi:hypothetical protein